MLAARAPEAENHFGGGPGQVRRMLANPMLTTPPPGFTLLRRLLATYVANLHRIADVVRGGRYHRRVALDTIKSRAAASLR